MNELRIADFSGGLAEVTAPADFKPGQWARIAGFVLDATSQLRSQWACQKVGTGTPAFVSITTLQATSQDYVIGICADGSIYYCVAPAGDADYLTTRAVTWTELSLPSLYAHRHFITHVPVDTVTIEHETGNQNVHNRFGVLVSNGGFGPTPPDVQSFIIYEDNGDPADIHLTTKTYNDPYPVDTTDTDGSLIPKTNVMPVGRCGTMWGDKLLLGNIVYKADGGAPLSASNGKAYEHGIWMSEGGLVESFSDISVLEVSSANVAVVGMQPIDIGLLVFTTTATERDGVILLRGTSTLGKFSVEILRAGIGAQKYGRADFDHKYHAYWPNAGSTVFPDANGGIWHTDGQQVLRLDPPEIKAPKQSTQIDHVAALDNYLFVSRAGRLLVMRLFNNDGAWTELITPDGGQPISLTTINDSVYFCTAAGAVYRYALTGPASSERGLIDGSPVELTLSSATVDGSSPTTEQSFDRKTWFQIGVRGDGYSTASKLETITTHAGAARTDAVPSHTETVTITGPGSFATVVPCGIGVAPEVATTLTIQGDVSLEAVSFWASTGRPVR